jgi:hypothetical protein
MQPVGREGGERKPMFPTADGAGGMRDDQKEASRIGGQVKALEGFGSIQDLVPTSLQVEAHGSPVHRKVYGGGRKSPYLHSQLVLPRQKAVGNHDPELPG